MVGSEHCPEVTLHGRTYSRDMGEMSGFGGSYERAMRVMVLEGYEFIERQKKAGKFDPAFSVMKNVTGIISEENDDGKALTKAMLDSISSHGDSPTGAMMQYSVVHVLRASAIGWDAYCKEMREIKKQRDSKEGSR